MGTGAAVRMWPSNNLNGYKAAPSSGSRPGGTRQGGGYMVYTPGHEGQDTVKRFVYADYVDGVIHTRKHKS